jgi:DNA-binding NtrC family response regulator
MKKTVLVVHDDPSVLAHVAARLEVNGHTVLRATSAAEAQRHLADLGADLLLCPLRLADVPASRAPEHFRSRYGDLPVILLATHAQVAEAASLLDRWVCDFVLAPVEEARLLTCVNNTLQRVALLAKVAQLEQGSGGVAPFTSRDEIRPFQQYERDILLHALATTGWNVKETATRLKIGRATLYRKIDRYDLRTAYQQRNAG